MAKSRRTRKWDWQSARYADLSCPEWLDKRVPQGFWDDLENHRRYITWLGQKLKITKLDDWYCVTTRDFQKNRGYSLINQYGGSSHVITKLFPSHDWKPWMFRTAPSGFWLERENRVDYLRWLGEQLGFEKPEDWYAIQITDFNEHYGGSFLLRGKMSSLVKELYPKFQWQDWKFCTTPIDFWQKRENRKRYVQWLGKKLGKRHPEDWLDVSYADFFENHGSGILKMFQNEPMAILQEHFPKSIWQPWDFLNRELNKFWHVKKNRIAYMKWLGKKLNFKTLDDWYKVSKEDFKKNRGISLLNNCYRHTPWAAVVDCFPKRKWLLWKFTHAPSNFWTKKQNRIDYLKWLGKQMGFKTWEDWYSISQDAFLNNHGAMLLQRSNSSPSRVVMEHFSHEYDWLPWCFRTTQDGYWKQRKNRVRYMKWLGEQMGYRRKEDWYQLRATDFITNYGENLWRRIYNGSALNALRDYRPSYIWDETRCKS